MNQNQKIFEKLYNNPTYINSNPGSDYTTAFIIFFILVFINLFLYIKIDFDIDVKNWDVHKCNPKYLFFSGYLKKEPNMSASETTNYNIMQCASSSNDLLKDSLDKNTQNNLNFLNKKVFKFDKNTNAQKKHIRDIADELATYNTDLQDISNQDIAAYGIIKKTGVYIDHLNGIFDYIKEYSKNALNHLMIKHLVKSKKFTDSTELDKIKKNEHESKMYTIKYILDTQFGGSILSE